MNIKNTTTFLLTLLITITIASCGGEKSHSEHEHNTSEAVNVKLNNGEKWLVNAEMKPHIMTMDNAVKSFKGSSLEDYTTIGAELKEHTQSLISSCTMTGPSHDELHVWLLPFMNSVNDLAEAKSEKEAKELFVKISEGLKNYNQFFK